MPTLRSFTSCCFVIPLCIKLLSSHRNVSSRMYSRHGNLWKYWSNTDVMDVGFNTQNKTNLIYFNLFCNCFSKETFSITFLCSRTLQLDFLRQEYKESLLVVFSFFPSNFRWIHSVESQYRKGKYLLNL